MAPDDADKRARERVGSVLKGKYRLDSLLGVGGMAAVYAATHLRNTNRVAVKVLHQEVALDAGLRERFLREGYAANSVAHPGTVRILDDDTAEDGAVFLVMELLEGETLEARWARKSGRLRAEEVAFLTYQLLDVLAAAHAKGIVHRDVKPENLFLTRERVLKVLDFGVARLLEGSATATRSGSVLGTPAFMAPEQVLGKTREVDAQSDVWSIGATAFTLLSGRFVHEAETSEEMMVFTASKPARSLATAAPDVPAPLVAVIDRALALDKTKRWGSARSMQKAVVNAYREAFGAPLPGAPANDEVEVAAAEDKTTVIPEVETDRVPTLSDQTSPVVKVRGGPAPVNEPVIRQSTVAGVTAPAGSDRRPRRLLLLAIGGAMAIAASAVLAKVVGSHQPSPAVSAGVVASGVVAPSSPSASPQATGSIPTVEPPSVAVGALPSTAPPRATAIERLAAPRPAPAPPAQPAAAPLPGAPAAPPPAATAPTKPGCAPPYTVDAQTGKKKWKVECL